jgi:hypothetical protein
MLRKNTAGQFIHIAAINATTGAALTGATISIRRCLDGTFAAAGATITEDTGLGFYKVALTQADTNGNDCGYFFTATNMIPICVNVITTAADPTDSVRFGLTALPNAAANGAGGVPVIGTGSNNFKSDASANVTFANTSIGSVTGSVNSVTSGVTVTTNNDKTGYSLTQAFPTNFSSLAITVGGAVTAGTVSDKTGYSLTQAFPTNFSSLAITAGGAVTVGTNNDKTGYTASTVSDKTGYSLAAGGIGSGVHASAELNNIADGVLDRVLSAGTDSGADNTSARTVRQALRALRNKVSISAGTMSVYKENDTTVSWTSGITTTAGNPISQSDPT